jgi:uncharacterized protein involved in type VI secretion and phage assembly
MNSRRAHKPIYAPVIGIVTHNKDPEKLGRVRVQIPCLPAVDDQKESTFWAWMVWPMAGANFGSYFLPEIDDQVLVVFQGGDIRFPFVVGGVWCKPDPPPEKNSDGKNHYRLIKSRSGHRLIFDDSNKGKVVLSDKDHKNYLAVGSLEKGEGDSPNAVAIKTPKASGSDKKKGIVVTAADGKMDLMAASGKIKCSGMTVEITCRGESLVGANGQLKVEGTATAKVVSGGESKYQGSMTKIG